MLNLGILETLIAGHVYSIDFPPEYNNWDRVEPLTLFGAPTVKQEANPKLRTGGDVWMRPAWFVTSLQDAEAFSDRGQGLFVPGALARL